MKKLLFAALSIMLAFSSCDKGNDYSIKNTSWIAHVGNVDIDLYFTSESRGYLSVINSGMIIQLTDLSYIHDHPKVTIVPDDGSETLTGNISGKQMTLSNSDGVLYVLTNQ